MNNHSSPVRRLAGLWASIAFANLWCLNLWQDIGRLQDPFVNYYRAGPPGHALFAGTVLCVLWLGALVFVIQQVATVPRLHHFDRFFQAMFIAACLLPASPVLYVVQSTQFSSGIITVLRSGVYLYIAAVVFALVSHSVLGSSRAYLAATGVNRLLSPLLPISIAFYIVTAMNGPSTQFTARQAGEPAHSRLASQNAGSRVVWIVFDEFTYSSAFAQRPKDLNLPELDRLRRESLFATNAYAPGSETLISMPALINGKPYAAVAIGDMSKLLLTEHDSRAQPWTAGQSVFSELRDDGARTALVGWFHPYCRILGRAIDSCEFVPSTNTVLLVREAYFRRIGGLQTAWYLLRDQLAYLTRMPALGAPGILDLGRLEQLSEFRALHEQATRVVPSPKYDVVVVHYPIPHPYGIFDRRSRHLGVFAHSTYIDNLALADRILGELRHRLEVAGLWDTTSLVISTDHSLRSAWSESLVEAEAIKAHKDSRIPFIVKLANNTVGRDYSGRVNTVVTRQLITSIWLGRISNIDELDHWLRGRP